ncbi:hypothetical protein IPG41_03695 [Candidatus Peregrinibacteria bacterium]|nr:MAG: hypothetical protein IPG41_03695 [Candidatus Peregrinibacteria bacterium]
MIAFMFEKICFLFLGIFFFFLNLLAPDDPDLEWIKRMTGIALPENYEVMMSEYEIMLGEESAHYELAFDADSCLDIIAELENLESVGSSQEWEWVKEGDVHTLANRRTDLYVDAVLRPDPSRLEGSCIFDFTILVD